MYIKAIQNKSIKFNTPTKTGRRLETKVYFERQDKKWLKEQAAIKGVSLSKYLQDLAMQQREHDIRLDLD